MRYLTLGEILELHLLIARATGGASGIRDLAALESAIAQPKATFDKKDLYPSPRRLFSVSLSFRATHLLMATSVPDMRQWLPFFS